MLGQEIRTDGLSLGQTFLVIWVFSLERDVPTDLLLIHSPPPLEVSPVLIFELQAHF